MDSRIEQIFQNHIQLISKLSSDPELIKTVDAIVELLVNSYKNKNKVLLCGNGGSASDAEHIAAELSGRFKKIRPALFAEALHVNGAAFSAIANDFGYKQVFQRMLEAKANTGDVLIAYSTSGKSENVLEAMHWASKNSCKVVGFSGEHNSKMDNYADIMVHIPASETARIQESYMLISHIICEEVENRLFP